MPGIGNVTTGVEMTSNTILEELRRRIPAMTLFSTNVSEEAVEAKTGIRVPFAKAGTCGTWNATSNNYDRGAIVPEGVTVTVDQDIITGYAITQAQLQTFNPAYWKQRGALDAEAIARTIFDALNAAVTAENFGDTAADKVTCPGTGVTKTVIASFRKAATKKKLNPADCALMLSPDLFADVLALLDSNAYGGTEAIREGRIPALFGFRAVAEDPSLSEGGFIAHPSAICFAARSVTVLDGTPYARFDTVSDPLLGLPLNVVIYTSGPSAATSYSVRSQFGLVPGNTAGLVRIIQA